MGEGQARGLHSLRLEQGNRVSNEAGLKSMAAVQLIVKSKKPPTPKREKKFPVCFRDERDEGTRWMPPPPRVRHLVLRTLKDV